MKRSMKKITTIAVTVLVCFMTMFSTASMQVNAASNPNGIKQNIIPQGTMQMQDIKYNQEQKIKGHFEEKYGEAVNDEYNPQNAQITKVLVKDPSHTLNVSNYSVDIYCRNYFRNPFDYYYNNISWEIRDSITVEQTSEGWLVSAPLDWELSDVYYININTNGYALSQRVEQSMANETINISPDSSYFNVDVNLSGGNGQFLADNITFTKIDENGVTISMGYNDSEVKIPAGKYNISLTGKDDSNTYILFKKGLNLSANNNSVNFSTNELSKLQLNLKDTQGTNAVIDSMDISNYGEYYYSAWVNFEGDPTVYVTKDNYDSLDAYYKVEENGNVWRYNVSKEDVDLEVPAEVDFGTDFNATITLDKDQYRVEDELTGENFSIKDEYGNQLNNLYSYGNAGSRQINAYVEFKGKNDFTQLNELDYFDYMNIPLPSEPGDYEVSFYLEEGPISITKASEAIKEYQSENEVILTLQDPEQNLGLSDYNVEIYAKTGDDKDYYYRNQNEIDRYAVKTETGWEIRIYDLDWPNNSEYYVTVNASNTVYMHDITKADVNKPIVLQTDGNYASLDVSVPFAQNKLYYQDIALGYVDENGKVMSIGAFYDNLEKGIKVPQGKYNIQVLILDKNNGYNLMKPKYDLNKTSNTIVFNRSDVVTMSAKINNKSDDEVKLDGMAPLNSDMWTTYHLSNFKGLVSNFYISKLDYKYLVFSTRVNNEWRYTYYTPKIEVGDNTVVNLGTNLKAELNFKETGYIPGNYLENDALKILDEYNNRVSYIMDGSYNYIGGTLEFKSAAGVKTNVDVPNLWYPNVQVPDLSEGTYDVTFKVNNNPLGVTPATAKITIGEAVKDTTPPAVLETSPLNSADNVSLDSNITVTFSEEVQPGTNFDDIKLLDSDNKEVKIEKSINGTQLVIIPQNELKANGKYTVIVAAGSVQDTAQEPNALRSKYQFSFNTIEVPGVKSTTPGDGEKDVKTDKTIAVTFTMDVQQGNGFENVSLKDSNNNTVEASVTLNRNTISIKPVNVLNNAAEYTVTIPKDAVKISNGNTLDSNYSFSFTTEKDKIAPAVVTSSVINNSRNIALNSEIIVLFSEAVKETSDFNDISLTDSKKEEVPLTLSIDDNKLIIKANKILDPETKYTLVVPKTAVQDTSDNMLGKEYKIAFTTVVLPKVLKTNPSNEYDKVKLNSKIDITFNLNISEGNSYDNIVLLDKDNNQVEIVKTFKGKVLTIKSNNDLVGGMTYTVKIPENSIADADGNAIASDYNFTFSTVADTYPPIVVSSMPAKSGKDAGIKSDIVLVFNENIEEGTTIGTIELKGSNKDVVPVTPSISGNTLTLSLGKELAFNTSYTLTVPAGAVIDEAGLPLKSKYTLSYKTMSNDSAPAVIKEAPKTGSTKVKVTSSISLTFNKYININAEAVKLSDNKGNEYEFECTIKNNVVTIKPLAKLPYESKITLLIPKDAVTNFDGTAMDKDYTLQFDTEVDKTAPVVVSSTPSSNGLVLAQDGKLNFVVLFNEGINLKDASKIILTDSKNKKINANISCSVDGNRLLIIVDDVLADGMKYYLTVGSDALTDKAVAQNLFKKTYKLAFIKAQN